MSIQFVPLGIPFSSSFAATASFALQTPTGGLPNSASVALFALLPLGPSGSDGITISGSVS